MVIAAGKHGSSQYSFILTASSYPEYLKLKEIYSLVPQCENYTGFSFLYNKYDFDIIVKELDKIGLNDRRMDKDLHESIKALRHQVKLPIHESLLKKIKREVKPFQVEAIERMSGSPFYLLGDDMGAGKSAQVLLTALNLFAYGKATSAIIIATPSSLMKWEDECRKIFGSKHGLDIVVADESKQKRMDAYRGRHQITVVNLESFARDYQQLSDSVRWKRHVASSVVILDEAHRIKNTDTKNHRAACALGGLASYKYALTGTPMDGRLTSIYGIFKFLHPAIFGKAAPFDKFHVKRDYFGGIKEFKNVDVVEQKIKPFMIRRKKRDIMDSLPPIVEKDYIVAMTAEEKRVYKKIEQGKIGELKKAGDLSSDSVVDEDSEISIFSACCQWCDCPGLVDPKWKSVGSKMKALDEILEEIIEGGNKVVVFTKFKMMLDILNKYLKYDKCLLFGGMTPTEREESMRSFLTNPEKMVFLMTTAGKESIDLHGTEVDGKWIDGANYLIKYDSMLNPAVNEQIAGRIDRIGQRNPMTVINLFSQGTVEEKHVRETLMKRMKINAAVLEGAGL